MDDEAVHTCEKLVSLYTEIGATRMDGVPILNNDLEVAAFGFEPYRGYQLGVLATPWFMNLVLLPIDAEAYAQTALQVGAKVNFILPAGNIEFIVGHEEAIGYILSCSLFSPVFEFEDQEAFEQTAEAALAEVLNENAETEDSDPEMTDLWAGKLPEPDLVEEEDLDDSTPEDLPEIDPKQDVSRRDFFRGGTRKEDMPVEAEDVT